MKLTPKNAAPSSKQLGSLPPEVLEAARIEKDRRRSEEPLRYFKMNPAIERFARAWCDPQSKIVLFPASNAIGKTWGAAALLGWTMWPHLVPEEYSWFREAISLKIRKLPIHHSFRLCSTPNEVAEAGSFQQAIKHWWPPLLYRSEKVRKPYDSLFRATDSDWFGDVMTYEQAPSEFEGATRGIFLYNEPPPRPVRQACVQRTRMGGMEVFPMTPLADAAYIDDELVEKAPNSSNQIQVVTGEMEEACTQHSPNGHLDHDQIQYLTEQMDPDERDARSKGKFMHLSGVIFKKFDTTKFVAPTPLRPNPLYPQFQCIDPAGFNKPFAILWGQVAPEPINSLQILREWPNGSLGDSALFEKMKDPQFKVKDYASLFREVETELYPNRNAPLDMTRIMDKRFGNNQDITAGKTLRDHFTDHGYDFIDSYSVGADKPEVRTGIQATNNYFEFDALTSKAKILIDPSCVNLIRAIKRWGIDPKTNKPKDDVFKNFCDVLRYICSHGFLFTTPLSNSEWNSPVGQPYYATGDNY